MHPTITLVVIFGSDKFCTRGGMVTALDSESNLHFLAILDQDSVPAKRVIATPIYVL